MFEKSIKAYEEACEVIPGGVDSPVRAFKSVGDATFYRKRKGCLFIRCRWK